MKMEPKLIIGRQRFLQENDNDSSDSMKSCETIGKPINLKQTRASQKFSDKETSDTTEPKCARTKAFTIKDILGLDERDKIDDINGPTEPSGSTLSLSNSERVNGALKDLVLKQSTF